MRIAVRTLILVGALVVLWGMPALAFHDDGVAHCNGCHTMHNSEGGVAMNYNATGTGPGTDPGTGWSDLLLYEFASDVCLDCHAGDNGSYDVWATDPLAPNKENGAGDFVFLQEDNINDGHGGADEPILGYASGHSILSALQGATTPDPDNPVAPGNFGGAGYPAADLRCTSCHDPHGTDAFRLLYRDGQTTTSDTGFIINWGSTIVAGAINVFAGGESDTFHNAYQSGYSEWCAECHGDFHQASGADIHPSGEVLDADEVAIYNAYTGSVECVGVPKPCGSGTNANAYWAQVPFEDPDITSITSTMGPDSTNSRVVCVTCHRAHATSAPNATRWDMNVTGMEEDGDESGSYKIPNPYGVNQRSLCNKCHAQDEFDALYDFTP